MAAPGKLALGCSGLQMPSYYPEEGPAGQEKGGIKELLGWGPFLVLVYFYYVFSCGLEGFFQSNIYTYALCGPLDMSPGQANLLNGLYFAAFVTGRLGGIFISRMVSPTKIIIASISGCLVAALLLSFLAPYHKVALFVGVILMGFAISFQFASGISWTANLFNVTGRASFIFFLGGFSGFLSFPPMAGAIITHAIGGFFHLATVTIVLQVRRYHSSLSPPLQAALFGLMVVLARGRDTVSD
jgi:MFS family permease